MSIFKILVAVLVFGVVVMIHELGHFLTAKYSGIRVNEFSIGMGPKLFSKKKGDTAYSVRALPIGGFVSMEGEDEDSPDERSFQRAPVSNRILVVVAGACMNLILGFTVLLVLVCAQQSITSRTVSSFYEGATTQASGLAVGDEIIAVNGRRCFIADDIVYEFARTQNGTADFTVKRNGEKVALPGVTFNTSENEDGTKSLIIDFTVLPVEKTPGTVLSEAFNWTISIARLIFLSLVDLVSGRVAINQLSGPVGIVTVIGEAVSMGWQSLLFIGAMLTINLGVFNLMPLPALDGGRLFLLLVEAVRKKPLDKKYEAAINTVGFVALMLLMVAVTFSDITKMIK